MQRLIEQPTGDGEVFEGARPLGRVHYHLSVYQQFSQVENEPVPASLEVEGRLTPLDPIDLVELHRRRAELTLQLADGRMLECSVAEPEGTIRSTGRALYEAR